MIWGYLWKPPYWSILANERLAIRLLLNLAWLMGIPTKSHNLLLKNWYSPQPTGCLIRDTVDSDNLGNISFLISVSGTPISARYVDRRVYWGLLGKRCLVFPVEYSYSYCSCGVRVGTTYHGSLSFSWSASKAPSGQFPSQGQGWAQSAMAVNPAHSEASKRSWRSVTCHTGYFKRQQWGKKTGCVVPVVPHKAVAEVSE